VVRAGAHLDRARDARVREVDRGERPTRVVSDVRVLTSGEISAICGESKPPRDLIGLSESRFSSVTLPAAELTTTTTPPLASAATSLGSGGSAMRRTTCPLARSTTRKPVLSLVGDERL